MSGLPGGPAAWHPHRETREDTVQGSIPATSRGRGRAAAAAGALALAAAAALAAPTTASAAPAAKNTAPSAAVREARTEPCESGHVCVYEGDIWDDSPDHPMVYSFYRYGTYNVANLVGEYTVVNCQTGGAGVRGFTGSNGTGSVAWDVDIDNCGTGLWTDLTSTNSVQVYA
jgi:hypothetical protein